MGLRRPGACLGERCISLPQAQIQSFQFSCAFDVYGIMTYLQAVSTLEIAKRERGIQSKKARIGASPQQHNLKKDRKEKKKWPFTVALGFHNFYYAFSRSSGVCGSTKQLCLHFLFYYFFFFKRLSCQQAILLKRRKTNEQREEKRKREREFNKIVKRLFFFFLFPCASYACLASSFITHTRPRIYQALEEKQEEKQEEPCLFI